MPRHEWKDMADEALDLRAAMAELAPVEQAKGILMAHVRCTPERAASVLDNAATTLEVSPTVVARALIAAVTAGTDEQSLDQDGQRALRALRKVWGDTLGFGS